MRLNFTGRRKIDRQHARISILSDNGVPCFEIGLELGHYPTLPPDALVFVEAYRKLVLMRFDLGRVCSLRSLLPLERRLTDFGSTDGVKFRLKVTQADGTEAGKLLAEADGLAPARDTSLIQLVGADDLDQTPWELELVSSDPDIPTLRINNKIGGKDRGNDPGFRASVLPPVVREVFTQLVLTGVDDENREHWAYLWSRLATEALKQPQPPQTDTLNDDARRWVKAATDAFCRNRRLADRLLVNKIEGTH